MFDLPPPGRFGTAERRFLAYLYGRQQEHPFLPTLSQAQLEGAAPSRGRVRLLYHTLERKKMLYRRGHEWRTGGFTTAGRTVARALYERRDRLEGPRKQSRQPRVWTPDMPVGSLYPNKVRSISEAENPFRPGSAIGKLGPVVTKGRLKGARIYFLTLEERATCPTSCAQWSSCYGNNMGLAVRWKADAALMAAMDYQIGVWAANGRKKLIRLHELGDFPTVEYVAQWIMWLTNNPWLHVFGYTAWPKTSRIGRAIAFGKEELGDQFAIRWSGSAGIDGAAVFIDTPPAGTFACPEQQKRVVNCGACGACWSTRKAVAFAKH